MRKEGFMPVVTQRVPMQPIQGYSSNAVLAAHLGNINYLLQPEPLPDSAVEDEVIETNEDFWHSLQQSHLIPGISVTLNRFHILDWFPRAPGLYHTRDASFARDEAFYHLLHGVPDSPLREYADQSGEPRPEHDYAVVFTPEGKLSMLQGGIGCIRLKPIDIFGVRHWLMTATSDGIGHAGIPIALPLSHCRSVLRGIQEQGTFCATVHGQLDFLPDPFSRLFDNTEMVPKIFLRVTALDPCQPAIKVNPEVSVAVSFLSDYKGWPDVYATYVTFRPDIEGSFEEAISWMKHRYVEGEYRGRIITDFDQTRTIFTEARLALSTVMDRLISRGSLRETIELMHATANVDAFFDEMDRQRLLPSKAASQRTDVFVSYAHAPERHTGWVERIRVHLEGLTNYCSIQWWDDTRINPGDNWQREIQNAIRRSRVAILILTADFLKSKYIREAELPLLLEAADADGAKILCIYGSDVHFSGVSKRLLQYHFVNEPDRPLQDMSEAERESVYKRLAEAVEQSINS